MKEVKEAVYIEPRMTEDTGFVYVLGSMLGDTRVVYAPEYIYRHEEEREDNKVIVLCDGTGGWRQPNERERTKMIAELRKHFPDAVDYRTLKETT